MFGLMPEKPKQSCENCRHIRYKDYAGSLEREPFLDVLCAIQRPEFIEYESYEQAGFNCLNWDYYDWDEHNFRESEARAKMEECVVEYDDDYDIY